MENLEDVIYSKEMDMLINKCGSFCGILLSKSISCVTLFSQLLEDEDFKEVVEEIGGCSWFDVVTHMTYRYPVLHKSKKIKKLII